MSASITIWLGASGLANALSPLRPDVRESQDCGVVMRWEKDGRWREIVFEPGYMPEWSEGAL